MASDKARPEKMMTSNATLHLLCGKPGAGTSTLAASLAADHAAILIAEDIWLIRHYGPMKSFDDYKTYSQRARTVVGPLVVDLLRRGINVVLDYPANTKLPEPGFDHYRNRRAQITCCIT